jgi:acyl-CoA synthetase (AMP-forming)/AMP-acid ligase II
VLTAQAQSLVQAWEYSPNDHLLHVLPLHHIHGTVNAILAPLFAGSTIEFMFPFNATTVWERLAAPFTPIQNQETLRQKITFFTAVPTIYNRLLSAHPDLPTAVQETSKLAISPANLRLNISGSAALPTPTKSAWASLSGGNILLERYGMTEVGMALSCGLAPADRVDGGVGWPLPGVEARLVDMDNHEVIPLDEEGGADGGREREGEIQLRGPTVFSEYWANQKATKEEFVDGGDGRGRWFKTGDVAVRRTVEGAGVSAQEWARGPMYFIRGRKSVDIIKTGGEKVSALEVERELLSLLVFDDNPNLILTRLANHPSSATTDRKSPRRLSWAFHPIGGVKKSRLWSCCDRSRRKAGVWGKGGESWICGGRLRGGWLGIRFRRR